MDTREHAVKVSLNSDELARLDQARGSTERAVYLRTLLYEPPDVSEVASHKEALALLSRLARAGGTAAAVALERALRDHPRGNDFDDELSRLPRQMTAGNQGRVEILSAAHPRPPPVAPFERTRNFARLHPQPGGFQVWAGSAHPQRRFAWKARHFEILENDVSGERRAGKRISRSSSADSRCVRTPTTSSPTRKRSGD
jgi:hypothetical protein